MKEKRNGFTLVELLVVLVIMGILSAVAIGAYATALAKRRENVCISNMATIDRAQAQYYEEEGVHPPDIDALMAKHYFKTKPYCPGGGTYSLVDPSGDSPEDSSRKELKCSKHGKLSDHTN